MILLPAEMSAVLVRHRHFKRGCPALSKTRLSGLVHLLSLVESCLQYHFPNPNMQILYFQHN